MFGRGRKRELSRRYKSIKGCAICGENRAGALDYHASSGHRGGKSVSQLVSENAPMRDIKEAIRESGVLCSNHHRLLHEHKRKMERIR